MRRKLFLLALFCIGVFFLGTAMPVRAQELGTPVIPPGQTTWEFDAKTTEVGRRAERAREFINWVITHPSIDNHPVFRQVWIISAVTTFFLIILTVAVMGIGLIIARKRDVSFKVDVMPILTRVALLLIYTAFSYWIVLGLIQVTDIIMNFFIKLLNADKLFTIFFANNSEANYSFIGYRNFDPLVEESVKSSWFLVDFSSFTYFVMGIIFVMRKVVLWFLLIVSPFLALLMPFRLIRNTGWIWIGVFFQWAFYGPLFALFLGALTKIWESGIPYTFNFTRARNGEILFDLAINILYGGPAQTADGLGAQLNAQLNAQGLVEAGNSSSYVDTFTEYVIALIMLWVVMILPWWLLRIFRDYCCDGIYAMKNILFNMLGQMQAPPPRPPGAGPKPTTTFGTALQMPSEIRQAQEREIARALTRLIDVSKISTREITEKMNMKVSKVADIARIETNTQQRSYVTKIMDYMKNPMSAENNQQRSEFIKLKTELSQRAARGDQQAQQLLEATTSSAVSIRSRIQTLAQNQVKTVSIVENIARTLNISQQKVSNISNSVARELTQDNRAIQEIAQNSQVSTNQVNNTIQSASTIANTSNKTEVVNKVAQQTNMPQQQTKQVLTQVAEKASQDTFVQKVAQDQHIETQTVKNIVQNVFGVPAVGSVTEAVSNTTNISQQKVSNISNSVARELTQDNRAIQEIAQNAQVSTEQTSNVIQSISNVANINTKQGMITTLAQKAGVEEKKIERVLEKTSQEAMKEKIVNKVAQDQQVASEKVKQVAQKVFGKEEVVPVGAAEITPSPTMSVEEYEEIKQMWTDHYEKGEVPITETVKIRSDWLEKEGVKLENILNKLVSENEEVRAQGLEEVADIIPFFILGNMSIQDIATYLKAKRAAAREVQKTLEREKEVEQKVKKEEEEQQVYVEAEKKEEKAKTMEMKLEMEEPKRKEPSETEQKKEAPQKNTSSQQGDTSTQTPEQTQ